MNVLYIIGGLVLLAFPRSREIMIMGTPILVTTYALLRLRKHS